MMNVLARRLNLRSHRRAWFHLAALLIAIIAAAPLLQEGALLNTRGGGDSPFLLQRVQQLVAALQDGHFPVRWMPDAAYGYGYPFYNYYAPLSIYVAAFFRFVGAPFTTAIQLSQLSAFLLAAWATFALARRWLHDDWAALLASAAYTLAPFHLLNVYVRGDSLAEYWAMALYPLVLLTADRLLVARDDGEAENGLHGRAIQLALAYAALILSHNISALIFSPFLLLYVLLASWRAPAARRRLLWAGGALGLALLLSAWFWLPALGETALVQTAPVTEGYFHYSNHFRSADLVQNSLLFDWNVAGQAAFRMGLVQALLIIAAAPAILWHWRHTAAGERTWRRVQPLLFVTLMLLVATLMITPLSRWLWRHLPLLAYTQFPWRFLSVQALAGALISGGLAFLPGRRWWALGGSLLLLAAMMLPLRVEHFAVVDDDVHPYALAQYEWFTGNIGTTVSAEYLPHTVQPRPYTSSWLESGERHMARAIEGQSQASLLAHRATRQSWQVSVATQQATVQFSTLYWPGWQARVRGGPLDGERLPVAPAPGSGFITVQLPPGEHQVELFLGRTPLRLAAELLSLATVAALLLWAILRARRRPALSQSDRRLWLLLPLLLLALVLYMRLRPQPHFDDKTLTWDFAQMGYLHHAPQGVRFDDGSRLLRYEYGEQTPRAGESLHIFTEWQRTRAGTRATLALVTPAANRFPHAPQLTAQQETLQSGRVIFVLQLPPDTPPGLYVPRLTRGDAVAQTPSGEARGPLFLRPVRIEAAPDTAPGDAAPAATLDARLNHLALPPTAPARAAEAAPLFDCAANPRAPHALRLHLAWYTAQPLGRNLTTSLRLNGADGSRIAQCDMQPGYGFLPSTQWTPAAWTPDLLALPLPPALPPSAPYVLLLTLYDESGATHLTRRLGALQWDDAGTLSFVPHEPQFSLPQQFEPLQARFGETIALRGYRLQQQPGAVTLTLYWEALDDVAVDLSRFVHLLENENGAPLSQQDGAPQNGAYPTSQWTAGEIVADTVTLNATDLTADDLLFAVGFYPPGAAANRLPVTIDDQPLVDRLLIRP